MPFGNLRIWIIKGSTPGPSEAGIQNIELDPGFRRGDGRGAAPPVSPSKPCGIVPQRASVPVPQLEAARRMQRSLRTTTSRPVTYPHPNPPPSSVNQTVFFARVNSYYEAHLAMIRSELCAVFN